MAKRTNRVEIALLSNGLSDAPKKFKYLAWKITIVAGGALRTKAYVLNGIPVSNGVIVLGGAFDDNGCPIDTLFTGQIQGSVTLYLEFTDPDIGNDRSRR